MQPLKITSEIGQLKSVVLKRPGKEVENLIPQNLQRLMFDDIPYLPVIQREHDAFAKVLHDQGVEVLYLDDLMEEALITPNVREGFINQFLHESKAPYDDVKIGQMLREYLLTFSPRRLVEKLVYGIRKEEMEKGHKTHLHEFLQDAFPFYLPPLPNMYYMRDPAFVIGNGITLLNMKEEVRQRESMFFQYILKNHPRFRSFDIDVWLNRDYAFSLEGGDILVLSKDTVAIGISERTSAKAIEQLAVNLFKHQSGFTKLIAVELPKSRTYMHLDTVFSMVDRNKFCIHSVVLTEKVYLLEWGTVPQEVKVTEQIDLETTLKKTLGIDKVVFIFCGADDKVAAAREQWNDATNTLALSPGVVISYDRNYITNDLLRENGVTVLEIESSELSRGGGGPRCMSMPLVRNDL